VPLIDGVLVPDYARSTPRWTWAPHDDLADRPGDLAAVGIDSLIPGADV
jgi:hypothetical protein